MKSGLFAAGLCVVLACGLPAKADPVMRRLTLWLKADNGLATDGSAWADQSGNGHGATALQGQAPTYVASAINGLPAAHFSGAQVMSIAGQIVTSQQFTIIVVATDESTPQHGNFCEIISNWSGATGGQSIFLGTVWKKPGDKFWDRFRFTDEIGGAAEGQNGEGHIKKPAHAFILSAVSSKKNASVFVGTKKQYALGESLDTRDLSAAWFLGDQGALNNEFWLGDIAEVLVYDRALSKQELATDVAYLAAKWQ
jgi:hypothetical protein